MCWMMKNENLYKGGPLCFYLKKDKILRESTIVFDFYDHMGIYTREYHYIFEKYHVKKFEKQGGYMLGTGVMLSKRSELMSC